MYRFYIYTFIVKKFGMKMSKVLSRALVFLNDICKKDFCLLHKVIKQMELFFKKN